MTKFLNPSFSVYPAGGDNWERTFRECVWMSGTLDWCAKHARNTDKARCMKCADWKTREEG